MRHVRFDVASLAVEGVPVLLKAAYLLVADPEGGTGLQWECLAYGLHPTEIPPGRHPVEVVTLDGRLLAGPAVLVRSIDGAHVLRGDGPLEGFDPAELG